MDFGKIKDVSKVDFSLPTEPSGNTDTWQQLGPTKTTPKIYIGSARWSEKSLLGKLYPHGTVQKDYLYHYARQFNTVEMNTTHYRIPTQVAVDQWTTKVPAYFKFCPKVPQSISHSHDFGEAYRASSLFQHSLRAFGGTLGLSFMQLPPTFGPYQQGKELFTYLEKWPGDLPLAIEFRHPEWFADPRITRRTFDLLRELALSSVITDTAGRRDVVHMQVCNARQAVRFVGNSLHPTDYSRIDAWIDRIGLWLEQGLRELYFFVHQPEEHLCVDLSIYLIHQLNEQLSLDLQAPRVVRQAVQKRLF